MGVTRGDNGSRPRAADRKQIEERLNRLASGLNALHGELSELRHDLCIADRIEDVVDEISHRKSVLVAREREAHAPAWGNDDADF
jgi:hypothetical protein